MNDEPTKPNSDVHDLDPNSQVHDLDPNSQVHSPSTNTARYGVTIEDVTEAVVKQYGTYDSIYEESRKELVVMAERVRERCRTLTVTHSADACVDRFIDAEMDFITIGERGPGRMSDYLPRFAAKHRALVAKLSTKDRMQLGWLMKRHVLCGYAFMEFLSEFDRQKEVPLDPKTLYEDQWVSTIYSVHYDVFPDDPGFAQFANLWATSTAKGIVEHIKTLGGTWDEHRDVEIIHCYFVGGSKLRSLEARPLTPSEHTHIVTAGAYSPGMDNS